MAVPDIASPASASAEARTEAVLHAIAQADGPYAPDAGADLSGLLANSQSLRGKLTEPHPAWWSAETNGLALERATLQTANLNHANLRNANLRGADLKDAVARSIELAHAVLEQADLTGADLSGAVLTGAKAGEARFDDAMCEDATFEKATLRFASFRKALIDGASFKGCDLWGTVFDGADADEVVFESARLDEASLLAGNFNAADFANASLKKVKLQGAVLQSASFQGARLEGANLRGADLSRASLPRVNLLSCDIHGVRLAEAWLESTRLRADQLGGKVGEELAGEYDRAALAYLVLEQNFRTLGDGDGESWAFRKRRRMAKLHARRNTLAALRAWMIRPAVQDGLRWASDSFVEWLCDYGESLWRTVRAFGVTIAAFAVFYGLSGTLTHVVQTATGPIREVTRNPLDLVVYSFLNMLSTSAPDVGIKPSGELIVLISSLQGALGIVLIGLFGYVLGNRMHR